MSTFTDQKQDLLERLLNIRLVNKLAIILISTILFLAVYQPLHILMGNGVTTLSLLPVLLFGLFFGFRAGVTSALLFFFIDFFLIIYYQIATFKETLTSGIVFGAIALFLMGALVGYMSDLRKILTNELKTRKKIEVELLTQRKRVMEILNQQQDIVSRFTPDFTITYINPIGQKIYQNQIKDLVGVNLLTLFSEAEKKYIQKFFSRPEIKNKPIKFEYPISNDKKEKLFFQWVVTPIYDDLNQVVEYQAVGRDTTENQETRQLEREQRQVIEALSNSAAILNSSLDLNNVLKRILENIGSVVPHDAANIMLVKNKSAKMVQLIGYEKFVENMDSFRNLEFPLTLPNFHQMIMTDQGVIIPNTKTDHRWQAIDSNSWIGSYLGAPLIFKNNLVGFINLDSTRTNYYQEKHIEWLQAFADQAVIAIKNAQLFEEVNERAKQLSLLNQAARIAINATTLDEIQKSITKVIREVFKTDTIQISIWDEKMSAFNSYFEGSIIIDPADFNKEDKSFQKNFAQKIMEKEQILVIQNVQNEKTLPREYRNKIPAKSLVLLPLIVSQQKIGLILLGYSEIKQIQQHEIILMEQFAQQTGLAISKTKMYIKEKERTKNLSHTNEILATITAVAANTTLDLSIEEALNYLGIELKKLNLETFIAFLSPDQEGMDIQYVSLKNNHQLSQEKRETLRSLFTHIDAKNYRHFNAIFIQKQTLFIKDAMDDIKDFIGLQLNNRNDLLPAMGFSAKSRAFILPLIVSDQVIGLITVWGENIHHRDQSTFMILAMQIANLIEKNRLYQKIQQLAITDSLTGFYNRRGLEELGKHEIERAIRFERPLTALMIDIDHFKHVNDSFGHPVGDEILVQLAQNLQTKLRDVDILCRYGGEEFFVMLPETNIDSAYQIADRIRLVVQNQSFSTAAGLINISISIGICYLSKNVYTLENMINYADQALYLAKQSGRNNVKHYVLHLQNK